jgi:lipopolysaccharide/colanic/teichoic acid biosynthesis glycosyltransferase
LALAIKRAIDIVAASVVLILLLPVLGVIAALIWLESGSPIFYFSPRYGRDGSVFIMYKYRTMVRDAEKQLELLRALNRAHGRQIKIPDDPRVTRVGRLLRRTSLDELPNLLNVIRGEMSLIGPRPHTVQEYPIITADLRERLRMRPGISGLWQVTARNHPSEVVRASWDRRYTQNWSLALDLQIALRTVPALLRLQGGEVALPLPVDGLLDVVIEGENTGAPA